VVKLLTSISQFIRGWKEFPGGLEVTIGGAWLAHTRLLMAILFEPVKKSMHVILSEAKDPGSSLWFSDLRTTA
jgi:hypothetical protein